MAVISRSTEIQTSPEKAYNYLVDVKNHADWGQHNVEVTSASDGAIAVGSKWETVGHQFGDQPATVTLTELTPNEKIVYESDGKVGHFRHGFTIEPGASGSIKLTKTMEMIEVRSLPLKIMRPIVSSFIAPKGVDGDLSRIKAKLEGA